MLQGVQSGFGFWLWVGILRDIIPAGGSLPPIW